jgi:uncharacterized membrane protein YkoI
LKNRFVVFAILISFPALASAAEKKIQMQDLPAAVQQAVQAASQGAAIRGFAQEVENGKTLYEAELTVNGRAKDITFDATGRVVSVEEEVPLESLPAGARDAIRKAVGTGKLQKVESVRENGTTSYEASIRKGGKFSEVKVDANGAPVK